MMITPQDLGFPPKFARFHPGQLETALSLSTSDKRYSLLSAPTGTGKSPIYIAVSRLLSARTLILTGTKGLQNQLMADFSSMGLVDVRGRSNYTCREYDTCDDAGKLETTCPFNVQAKRNPSESYLCTYQSAINTALSSSLVVTNYAFWLSLAKFSDPFAIGEFDLLVLDEAHSSVEWMCELCSIELDSSEIQSLIRSRSFPSITDPFEDWINWAHFALERAKEQSRNTNPLEIRRRLKIGGLIRKLTELINSAELTADYLPESVSHSVVRLSLLWPRGIAEPYLFRSIPRIVLSSAFVSPQDVAALNIEQDDCNVVEVPSTFPKHRRPVIFLTPGPNRQSPRIDHRTSPAEISLIIRRLDQLIESRLDRKGIIHCRSYEWARHILEKSEYSSLFLAHKNSTDLRDTIQRFKSSHAPSILLSPSIIEGFDFPDDQCRYQVIWKVPFVDSRSPVIKARAKSDETYLDRLVAQDILQMVGRGVRSRNDFCETFIFDGHWLWFNRRANWPEYFSDAFQIIDVIPDPPDLMTGPVQPKIQIKKKRQ